MKMKTVEVDIRVVQLVRSCKHIQPYGCSPHDNATCMDEYAAIMLEHELSILGYEAR